MRLAIVKRHQPFAVITARAAIGVGRHAVPDVAGKTGERRAELRHFIGKRMHIAAFRRVIPVHLRRMLRACQRIEHRQHRRLTHTRRDKRHRRLRFDIHKEIARRRGKINHIARLRMLMQPVRHLAFAFAFHRNAIAFTVRLTGERILANLLVRKPLRLDPDGGVLAGQVIGDRAAIHRLQLKACDNGALRRFIHDAEFTRTFPAAGFLRVALVNLGFAVNKHARQHAIGFAPRVQHFLAWAEHLIERRQQVLAHNVVLLRFDIKAGVLLGDFLHRRQQGREVFDISGVGADGVEQRFTLIAIALVAHVENLFQLRVVCKHPVIKVRGEFRASLRQQRDGGFHDGDGLTIQHGCFLPFFYKMYFKCIL
ncbi:hypothetical protein BN129_2290 [Cronobacter sakazakii 701]|nr:hypothetical protein BN129_2290 [Cronobacter sakazakii 701]